MQSPRAFGLAVVVTTALVTAVSYLAPEAYSATAVGVTFLAATWLLVLRGDAATIRAHGLSMGGLLEPEKLVPSRLASDAARAAGVALACFAIIAPSFFFGYRLWFHPRHAFDWRAALPTGDEVLGQLVVIALPEEAFFRGFVQTRLKAWLPRSFRVAGLPIGSAIVATSAIFAVGHLLTVPNAARLAVFFPSLLFGALRERENGIGAGLLLHALCNLLSSSVAHGYHPGAR
ncbi:MAG: MrtC family glutamic-type intramembrane protease [Polyangiaceae bacterium]